MLKAHLHAATHEALVSAYTFHARLHHCLSKPSWSSGKRGYSFILLPHPAGVRGVEKRREISALVGPNSPVCEATFTKTRST